MNQELAEFYHNTVNRLRGWDTKYALSQLEKTQWQAPAIVGELRLKLLKKLLFHANAHVPYYRIMWSEMGFVPDSIASEKDLLNIPITTKETLRENYNYLLSEKSISYDTWSSSGSTGKPFPFRLDKQSITYNTFAALARGRRWWGFKYGQPEGWIWAASGNVSRFFPSSFFTLKRRMSWALKNIKIIDVHDIDEASLIKGYQSFRKHQPVLLRAISSGLYRFCTGLQQLGLDGTCLGLKAVIFTGESLPDVQRKFVEEVLNCKTICEYGCTEVGIIGFECPEGNIHLSHDNLVFEFLRDGKPAKPGEIAELVITNLRNYVSPLIRYSIGDLVVPTDAVCSCGRTLPIIESIQGRQHDSIVTPDGKIMSGSFFSHVLNSYGAIHQYRVIQDSVDSIRLELVSPQNINLTQMHNIRKTILKHFGSLSTVELNQVSKIPVSNSGKTPYIISNVARRE